MKPTSKGKEWFRFKCSLKGIVYGFVRESHFRFQCFFALIVVAVAIWFKVKAIEWALLVIVIGLVLVSEMLNTVVEDIMDFIHPNIDERVGHIKDLAAGSVLVSVVIAMIVGLLVFLPYLVKG